MSKKCLQGLAGHADPGRRGENVPRPHGVRGVLPPNVPLPIGAWTALPQHVSHPTGSGRRPYKAPCEQSGTRHRPHRRPHGALGAMLRTRDWRGPPRMAGGSPTDGQSALQDPGLAPRSICANPAEMPPTHPDTIPHHLRRSGQAPHHQLALRGNPNRVPAKPRVCAPQARHTRSHAKPAAHCFIHICLGKFLMSTEPVGSTSHNVHSNN